MNYSILTTGIIALLTYQTYAQQLQSLELFAGPSRTSSDVKTSFGGFSYGPLYNFTAGVGARLKMTTRAGLSAKLVYEDHGSKGTPNFLVVGGGDPVLGESTYKMNIKYLTLPVLYSFRFGHKVGFSLDVGPHASFQLTRRTRVYHNGALTSSGSYHDDDRFKFGLTAGFNVEVPLVKTFDLTIGLMDNIHLSDIADNRNARYTNVISFVTGVRYKLHQAAATQ